MMLARPPGLGLGMIPDWQLSPDPTININLNPHLPIPPTWTNGQRTVQPFGVSPNNTHGDPLAATGGLSQMNGLGITMAKWAKPPAALGALEIFDSWAWQNRKWLVLGGGALIGLAALSGIGALLR